MSCSRVNKSILGGALSIGVAAISTYYYPITTISTIFAGAIIWVAPRTWRKKRDYSIIINTSHLITREPKDFTKKMLDEADHFLKAVERQEIKDPDCLHQMDNYKKGVDELRKNPDSKLHRYRFFLRFSFFPNCMVIPIGEMGAVNHALSVYQDERERVIKECLSYADLSSADINLPFFRYGEEENSWGILQELLTGFSISTIELALRKGADPNIQSGEIFRNTPLTWGIANGANEVVIEFIKSCKKLNIQLDLNRCSGYNGNTPLILSIVKGHAREYCISNLELTKFLLKMAADPNKPDINGNTPLHYACLKRDLSTIDLLIEHGALLKTNAQNLTPFDFLNISLHDSIKMSWEVAGDPQKTQGCCTFDCENFRERTKAAREKLINYFNPQNQHTPNVI